MAVAKLESILQYTDELLGTRGHPDYPTALNGLQVEGPSEVRRIAAAVDVSEATIQAALEAEAQLLVVHHGLFWRGLEPLTGRYLRRVTALLQGGLGLYSSHLPLDAHPDLGNCALLLEALGLSKAGRFGSYDGADIGWWASTTGIDSADLEARTGAAVNGPVRMIPGGPEIIERVAVLTGSGGGFVEEAARAGHHALVTGEASHHSFVDAAEYGVHLVLAGHYATETFGVRALASHLADRMGVEWVFLDHPTGL